MAGQAERPAFAGTSPTPVTSLGRAPETEGTAGPLSVLLILGIVALVVFVMLLGTRMRNTPQGKALVHLRAPLVPCSLHTSCVYRNIVD